MSAVRKVVRNKQVFFCDASAQKMEMQQAGCKPKFWGVT